MKLRSLTLMLALVGTASAAATLPLKPGTYVIAGTPCADPPLASLFSYDGKQLSFPHATKCLSAIKSHVGHAYRVETRCSALGDGSPAVPTTTISTYSINSATQVRVSQGHGPAETSYRWCSMPQVRKG